MKAEALDAKLAAERALRQREEELLDQIEKITASEQNMAYESENLKKDTLILVDKSNKAQKLIINLEQ